MSKQKVLYLGIIHSIVMEKPSVTEIINNPIYEEELKSVITKLKNKGNLGKAIKKVAGKHVKKIRREYVYLSDNLNTKTLNEASIIINVDDKSIVKNRFREADENEMINLYLERYADKIKEFDEKFGTKHA